MRSLLVRLLFAFGLTQALWLMALPASLVQAGGGVVTNCSEDSQFSSLLVGGGAVTFNCGMVSINLNSIQFINANTTIDGGGNSSVQ